LSISKNFAPPDCHFENVFAAFCFQLQMEVEAWFPRDVLKGDNVTELRVKFIRKLTDALPAGED